MKKIISYFAAIILIISCSEGDIIEKNIDINSTLENCFNDNDFVFYKLDNNTNQSLSVNFTSTTFDLTTVSPDTPITISLNGSSNILIYRQFDTSIDGTTYFCSSIPPSGIGVIEELFSSSGTIEISYAIKDDTDPTETVYERTIILKDITLRGDDIALRREFLELGNDEVIISK